MDDNAKNCHPPLAGAFALKEQKLLTRNSLSQDISLRTRLHGSGSREWNNPRQGKRNKGQDSRGSFPVGRSLGKVLTHMSWMKEGGHPWATVAVSAKVKKDMLLKIGSCCLSWWPFAVPPEWGWRRRLGEACGRDPPPPSPDQSVNPLQIGQLRRNPEWHHFSIILHYHHLDLLFYYKHSLAQARADLLIGAAPSTPSQIKAALFVCGGPRMNRIAGLWTWRPLCLQLKSSLAPGGEEAGGRRCP